MPRVAFHTLGCKVNQGETAAMAHLFAQAGYQVVDFSSPADVYIVNSCAVTLQAERKSRQMINRARDLNPEALLVMAGCYPQVAEQSLRQQADLDLIVGSADKPRIVELVNQALQTAEPLAAVSQWSEQTEFAIIASGQESERTRATLKVQDGCQQFCAYCIIPYARGPERSRLPGEVIAEAKRLLADGFQEIVLTGIHVGRYGRDLHPATDLATLVGALLVLPGLRRLRLSSIEPNEITDQLIDLLATHRNFCRHLHIPLQAGEDRVLQAMHRHYTSGDYAQVVERVRTAIPEVAITTDVIVGFPGETAAQFQTTCDFVQAVGFSRLHVFRYSRRPGTPAAELPNQIPTAEKERRSRQLIDLGKQLARSYASRWLGRPVDVLWEHADGDLWTGHTDTYLLVQAKSSRDLANKLLPARVTGLRGDGVLATVEP